MHYNRPNTYFNITEVWSFPFNTGTSRLTFNVRRKHVGITIYVYNEDLITNYKNAYLEWKRWEHIDVDAYVILQFAKCCFYCSEYVGNL